MLRPLSVALVLSSVVAASPAAAQIGGVLIDPTGAITVEPDPETPRSRRQSRRPSVRTAPQIVSLRRLLERLAARDGDDLDLEARRLAGLTRIDSVTVQPDDVLLTGPAVDADTLAEIEEAGQPTTVWLEDVAYAIEHVAAGRGRVGCSIDMRPENLKALERVARVNAAAASPAQVAARYRQFAGVLGEQDVVTFGLPKNSHAAVVTVAADVRMKRIALGVDSSGVRSVKSQLALMKAQGNSVQRWWFVPAFDPVGVSLTDGVTTYRISGPRVRVLAQEEVVDEDGNRSAAAATRDSTQAFARLFSQHMDAVAERRPEVDALQDLSDAFMVAGLLLHHERERPDGASPLRWDILQAVADARIPRTEWTPPLTMGSESAVRRIGRSMVGILGGVTMTPHAMPTEAGFQDAANAASDAASTTVPSDGWYAPAE